MAASSDTTAAPTAPAAALTATADALTAVVDVGKTNVRLYVVDHAGNLQAEHRRANAPLPCALGYDALDSSGIALWLADALAGLGGLRRHLRHIITTAHGAAFAALSGPGADAALAFPIPDYEFDGFDAQATGLQHRFDGFDATLCPPLPRGLNAATQIDWLQHRLGTRFDTAATWLPYPQYWAWWLSGVAASEVSSLGCHTQLWRPRERCYSELARNTGWAARFAPLRPAWQVLGPLRGPLARRLGLRSDVQVHCGVHDSNACLARYLRCWPGARLPQPQPGGTLVSSGTWTVIMAPGAPASGLDRTPDVMAGVSVDGTVVPTARFMGGRELLALAAGADPACASAAALADVLRDGWMALPGFEPQGGPFRDRRGQILCHGRVVAPDAWRATAAPLRATVALLYCAAVTAWLLKRLGAAAPVVVDGPLAASPVFLQALAAVLPAGALHANRDALEGTARGAWVLTRWTGAAGAGEQVNRARLVERIEAGEQAGAIAAHDRLWTHRIGP